MIFDLKVYKMNYCLAGLLLFIVRIKADVWLLEDEIKELNRESK
jgi:hypothetical protein